MKIINHLLHSDDGHPYPYRKSPNFGQKLQPDYLILHSSAGPNISSTINVLTDPQRPASVHAIIGRDGSITQLVPFNKIAWHAGRKGIWQDKRGVALNQCSIGIMLDNALKLNKKGDHWLAWWGKEYREDSVIEATHRYDTVPGGWHKYTGEQIEKATELGKSLAREYAIKDILGHEDIEPGLKFDPGPAFPIAEFRSSVLGVDFYGEPKEKLSDTTEPLKVFYSYAHEDEKLRDNLEKHLKILERKGFLSAWHDRRIKAGEPFAKEINSHLKAADIVLLLISADFIASDYCWENEMKFALSRHDRGEARVIPIILRPVDWKGAPFEKLNMLPKDAKPVTSFADKDEAFYDVSTGIRDVVEELASKKRGA